MTPAETQLPERIHLEWIRYDRPLQKPLRTGRGLFSRRSGLLLRLSPLDHSGEARIGEVAPLPFMGTESTEDAMAFFRSLPEEMSLAEYKAAMQAASPVCAFGMESCLTSFSSEPPAIGTAALLELDRETPGRLRQSRAQGFRTFKLKCGLHDADTELRLWRDLLPGLEKGDRLRLDPNRGWSKADWKAWKGSLAKTGEAVEFIEEPFSPNSLNPDQILAEAEVSPVPLALDESLSEPDGLLGSPEFLSDWPGYFVIKPFLLDFPGQHALGRREPLPQKLVLSSAFETGIGLSRLIRLAAEFAPELDHGLDTQKHFGDSFGLARGGPRLTALAPLEEEALWKRLSAS